ncbi:MAG TPA: DoxX family protein [Gemmatimonadales bacterium]|jgi:putative oxidoreductase|nr:DoxX family protein [Gemmatimonadales bacterium]
MNRLAPYAAFFMRLAVGGVFLNHGIAKFQQGVAGVAGFLSGAGFPFATIAALVLITVETVGAVCLLAGILTRVWAACMAIEMAVAILAVLVPHGRNFELEALLLAGAVTLVALGDGPLSLAVGFKRAP